MAQILGSDLLALQRVEGISLNDVAQVYAVTVEELSDGFDDLFVKIAGDEMTGPLVINETATSDGVVFDVKGDSNEDPDGSIFLVKKDSTRDVAYYLSTLDQSSNSYEVVNKKYVDAKIGGAIRYEMGEPLPPTFQVTEGDIWIDKETLLMYVYDEALDAADNPTGNFAYVALTGTVDSGQIIRSEAYIGDTPPGGPSDGDLWFDSSLGELRVYYTDNDSSQWVSVNNAGHDVAIDSDIKNLVDNVSTLTDTVTQLAQSIETLTVAINNNTDRIEMLELLNPNTVGEVEISGAISVMIDETEAYSISHDGSATNVQVELSSDDSSDTLSGFAITFGLPGTRTLTATVRDDDTPFWSIGTLEVEVVLPLPNVLRVPAISREGTTNSYDSVKYVKDFDTILDRPADQTYGVWMYYRSGQWHERVDSNGSYFFERNVEKVKYKQSLVYGSRTIIVESEELDFIP